MIVDQLRTRITEAVKAKDEVARDVLRLAFSEIQTAEARANAKLKDEEAAAILKKLVKSNEETLALESEGPRAATLRHEIEVLSTLLPKTLDVAQIVDALAPARDAILAAKNDGQATGVAMKHLKSTGATVEGTDVAKAVKTIRG